MLAKHADMTGGSASPIRRMRTPVRSRAVIDCPDNDPRLRASAPQRRTMMSHPRPGRLGHAGCVVLCVPARSQLRWHRPSRPGGDRSMVNLSFLLRARLGAGTEPHTVSESMKSDTEPFSGPSGSVKRKPTRRFPAEPLGLADVEALRAACSRRAPTGIRNRALLAVLFRSGLRISEALSLYPKDLDPVGGSLRVLHRKGDRARTAALPPDAAEAIDRWLDARRKLGITARRPLFCTLRGEALWNSYVRTLCKRLAAKAGVEKRVHPHGFRHGWALGQVQAGVSLNAIQALLGHRSRHRTSVYLQHIAPAAAVAEATAKTTHLAVQP